jgi:predicted SAM-dependent methyltransferase
VSGLNKADHVNGLGWILKLSRAAKHRASRVSKRVHLKIMTTVSDPLKIVVGAGGIPVKDWLLTDIDQLNILVEQDWRFYFRPGSIEAIVAEHVWEHLDENEALRAARMCFSYMRPGGRLRVAVPDGFHPRSEYIDAVKPGGNGPGADQHKALYEWLTLRRLFEAAGFETTSLEYFDEQGRFHSIEWDPDEGMIRRSLRFDPRNRDGEPRYTSIIIDAIKPEE